jgi:hypothetical protein
MTDNIDIVDNTPNSGDETTLGEFDGGFVGNMNVINEDLIDSHSIIDNDKIIKKVREYIDNYYSEQYNQYKIELDNLYRKVGKRFYTIQKKCTVYLVKNERREGKITDIQMKNMKYVKKITHPTILNITDRQLELNNLIIQKKSIVDNLFNDVKEDVSNRAENIKEFENHKSQYAELLEEREIIKLYYITINNINMHEEIINTFYQMKNENGILSGKSYKISKNIINDINKIQSDRYDKYINFINTLSTKYTEKPNEYKKDNELLEDISIYLKNIDLKIINRDLTLVRNKQDKYIDFIITKMPEF